MAGLIPFNRRKTDISPYGAGSLQSMLDDFFSADWPFNRSLACDTFKVDVQENEKEYIVEADLPGYASNEIDISLNDGKLQISIIKQEDSEEKGKNYVHRERRCTSMVRNIFLAEASSEGTNAKLDNGVLTVTVPKEAKKKTSVKIDVK